MIDEIRFLQKHSPGMTAGEYEITVEQEVTRQGTALDKFTTIRTFSVRGDRLTLKPSDVAAVFPPAGSQGDHANVLPHVMLSRSTLPWERDADPDSPDTPWLALLLFYEGETPAPKPLRLKDLNNGSARFPAFSRERGQEDDDQVTVIEVPRKLLETVLVGRDELAFLTHVRETQRYTVNDRSMTAMRAHAVPDAILLKLADIKDHEFVDAPAFYTALKNALGDQVTEAYYPAIATSAATPVGSAVVIVNRLPQPQGISTAHLISVEGRYNASGFDYQSAGPDDLIRLVSLQSWSFACVDPRQNFAGLLQHLDRIPSTLRLPDSGAVAANEHLAMGALPLWHGSRRGGKTVSWYHGPLTPAANPLPDADPSAPDLPVRAADELLRYHTKTGMFDVSYAAAWELGRLLALQSKSFSIGLYRWKRAHAQRLRQAEEILLHSSPLDAESDPEASPLPAEIAGWFKRMSLLEGVPFNYLVPDERLLPLESIRFFQVDWLWIDCLLDGAFSIGRVIAADHQRDAAHAKNPAANPHPKVSGMLIRSDVVAGWPGLLVDAFNGVTRLKLLRMDRLSANVLLCLFDGEATTVDVHQKPEMLHFGLDQSDNGFYKRLRDRQGQEGNETINSIPWSHEGARVIAVKKLASDIQDKLRSTGDTFTSAQFAFQMIENVEKVRFERAGSRTPLLD